jgi:UDP-glucose 4-epimerase
MEEYTALVTGGTGFIGSHLTDLLLKKGHEVIVLDNYSTGRRENLEHQKNNTALQVVQADICEYHEIEPYFEKVDWVFHLAALADIVPSIEHPLEYHRSNVDGTINVLEAARLHGAKRFIYTASSSCYGIPEEFPTRENSKISLQYPYALTKYIGEQYAIHWAKTYGLPVVSLRLFNVYGPRSRTSGTYGAVFGVFLKQKLEGMPFTVVGDGTQTRDFTYVSDVVEAFVCAAESDLIAEIMNVGSGGSCSINLLTELLQGPVEYIPKRPGEPDCTFADISKITSLLKWKPKVKFEQGVSSVLANIEYWRDAPLWDKESIATATKSWFQYLSNSE